ncbi:TetR family transcriptional regulator [Virgisporangium aliadipatigenens]|uniref:TetR family transcriptional regulator n=1 Tax=Virgisporangium aliadipatigenens TaxID=741659 RepID=A0A8J3YFC4_9ACTN|nr:TetR/AcrR family transcriptional regulator [Virgisporangium aliadipatigenens]GIJ43981.1 TetR family transcriptional regulator [Virgisporangium aliadipatigenens]
MSLTRRRGQALEDALLEAAYAELIEGGLSAFTFDGVAARAQTSRPVLYRRWPTREALVIAALRHHDAHHRPPVPDTGTLRGDLIAALKNANRHRMRLIAPVLAQFNGSFLENGRTPAELRRELIGDRVTADTVIVQRAVERGELDPARITPRIVGLAFDLFRHELLMTHAPVPDEVIEEIVDTIALPLLTGE